MAISELRKPSMPSRKIRDRWIVGIAATPVVFASFISTLVFPGVYKDGDQFWTFDLLIFVALPLAALCAAHMFTNIRPSDYGVVSPTAVIAREQKLLQLAAASGAFLLFVPLVQLSALVLPPPDSSAEARGYMSELLAGPYAVLASIYLSFSAAVSEEIFFRGILAYVILGQDDSDRVLYVVLSSALFGLSHFNQGWHVVIAAGLLGVATTLIYLKWRNVWYLIAAHVGAGLVTY